MGYDVIDWMAENLAAPDTGGHYKPYVVTREQAEFLLRFYEIDPAGKRGQGKRKIMQGVLSRPRGWGKSPFLAAIACAEALGPVVPGGWDADGQPVGIPWSEIRTPLVLVAAVSDKQVMQNSWTPILELLEGPVLDNYPGLEPLGGFVNLPRGRITPMPASARTAKGARAVFTIMDQALALDTPIPTPTGWSTMGALQAGDVIFGSDGRPVRVSAAKPVSLEHDCYRVRFSDGTSIVASAGHLWMSRLHSAAKPKVRTTRQMADDPRKFRIPAAKPLEMPAAELSVPPYLLGYWLGDGTRGKCEIAVSEDDLPDLQANLAELGVESWPRRYGTGAVNLTFTRARGFGMVNRPEVAKALAALDCYRDKNVPDEYLSGSIEQRAELLRGLMDSDGSCTTNGLCTFVNTNRLLADAVVRLLRSLGQVTSGAKWIKDDRYTGGGKYRVDFTPRNLVPFRLERKANRVHEYGKDPDWITISEITPVPHVPVRCIAVDSDDHLFVAGVGCHMTHNTEEWVASNGGLALAQTLRDNAAKIGGSTLESPNAFVPGEGSVAEETAAYWSAIVEGRRVPDRLLYDHREAPGDTDIDDDVSLLHGLAFAYGDSADIDECVIHDPPCIRPGWSDLEDRISAIRAPNGDLQMARGNFLNQITYASDQFIANFEWNAVHAEKLERDVPEVSAGDTVVLGFDGSRGVKNGVADSTALVGCRVKDGHLFLVDVWEQPEGPKGKGWNPPADQVDATVAECFKKFRVVGFYADPARWEGWVSTWEAKYGDRLKVGPKAHPIEWWMTGGSVLKAERAFESFREAVVQKELSHDGHPILWKHTVQGRRRIDHNHLTVKKDFPKSPRKIDAFIAAVLAWQARNDAVAKGLAVRDSRYYVPKAIR